MFQIQKRKFQSKKGTDCFVIDLVWMGGKMTTFVDEALWLSMPESVPVIDLSA